MPKKKKEEEENEEEEEKEDDDEENEDDEEKEDDEENEDDDEKDDDEEKEDEEKEDEEEESEEEENEKKKKKKGKKSSKKEKSKKKSDKKENNKKNKNKGNEIDNIPAVKKPPLQILREISTEMESLSSHLERVIPKINYSRNNNNFNVGYHYNTSNYNNYDKEDMEIKDLISRVNQMNNINNNYNNYINNRDFKKAYEDKFCQSEDENDLRKKEGDEEQSNYNLTQFDQKSRTGDFSNQNKFPYDPTKHIEYYNNLKNNNNFLNNQRNNFNNNFRMNTEEFNDSRIKKMDDLYSVSSRRKPIVYTQPNSNLIRNNISQINNNDNGNMSYNYKNERNFDDNNLNNNNPYERFKPTSISQAMNILLDKE